MEKTKDQIITDLKKDLQMALDLMEDTYRDHAAKPSVSNQFIERFPNIIVTLRGRYKI